MITVTLGSRYSISHPRYSFFIQGYEERIRTRYGRLATTRPCPIRYVTHALQHCEDVCVYPGVALRSNIEF
jgi:hypothetical protein